MHEFPLNFPVANYELIEHTADVGIRVKGSGLKELFQNAALAMFDIIAEKKAHNPTGHKNIEIKQEADNLDELFINWLNELLSLSSAKGLIFFDFKINIPDKFHLEAQVLGQDSGNYQVNAEIKAATYHQLKIEEVDGGWQAEVIFDV